MTTILDKHAPELKKQLTARPNTKWYNQNIRKAKVIRRRLERKKNKTTIQLDIDAFRAQAKLNPVWGYVPTVLTDRRTDRHRSKIGGAQLQLIYS